MLRPKGYAGRRENGQSLVYVNTWAGSRRLSPRRSQRVWNHSPDGFEWGYGGSGPAQLALAILLHFTGDRGLSVSLHQNFKYSYVAKWGDTWQLSAAELERWISMFRQLG